MLAVLRKTPVLDFRQSDHSASSYDRLKFVEDAVCIWQRKLHQHHLLSIAASMRHKSIECSKVHAAERTMDGAYELTVVITGNRI